MQRVNVVVLDIVIVDVCESRSACSRRCVVNNKNFSDFARQSPFNLSKSAYIHNLLLTTHYLQSKHQCPANNVLIRLKFVAASGVVILFNILRNIGNS